MTVLDNVPAPSAPARPALVLVLSGRRTAEALKAAGYRVGLASNSIPWDLALLADVPVETDLENWPAVVDAVTRIHRHNPVSAVVTQLEGLLPLAGQLRDRLGLAGGITEQAAHNCNDKATTNRLFAAAGLPLAASAVVRDAAEARVAVDRLGLPVIVKPRDASSGADMSLCDSVAAATAAVTAILAGGRDSALVEEFLTGTEISVFAYRSHGRTEVISCLEAQVGPPPKFVKLGADHPGALPSETLAAVRSLTDRALAAVDLDDWVATVQMMVTADGLRLMEINPRVPGGQTVELIAVTTGYEPTLMAAEVALGRAPSRAPARASHAWYRCLTFERPGRLFYRVDAEDNLAELETTIAPLVDIDVAPGEVVLPINHPRGGVFGRVVLCGSSHEQLARDYDRVLRALDFQLQSLPSDEEEALWRPHSRCC